MTKEQEKIYNAIKAKYGIKKADEVIANWEEYVLNANKYKEEKQLLELYHKEIEDNKRSLSNISFTGEYFNNRQSSFYPNKAGFLVFEDEKTKRVFETKILYEDFKEYVKDNLKEVAEAFVYLDTSDLKLMERVCGFGDVRQVGGVC